MIAIDDPIPRSVWGWPCRGAIPLGGYAPSAFSGDLGVPFRRLSLWVGLAPGEVFKLLPIRIAQAI
jgi:hypothetical protein